MQAEGSWVLSRLLSVKRFSEDGKLGWVTVEVHFDPISFPWG